MTRKPTSLDYISAHSEHLGGITPTLTRPHQGDGNEALPLDGGGLGGGDETTGLP